MSAILIISVILAFVAAASYAILRTRRPRSNAAAELPPPYGARGLFGGDAAPHALPEVGETDASEDFERELRERASRGDLETLKEARESGRAGLYNLILGVLLERAEGDAVALRALADFVARGEDLRSTPALAAAALEDFARGPARSRIPTLLRVAALSDDASAFESAMTAVARAQLEGRLPDSDADELRALFDAEYWLLSSEARRSGAGFQLKQKLAQVRRSLADDERRSPTPFGKPVPAGDAAQKERQ
ncbi:MAG TPA: hypothetical protein VM914_07240 [Pyrinomonadaceae bacterium]|nr:hypothetical protein [Pyrinomonadaceae bacterium]